MHVAGLLQLLQVHREVAVRCLQFPAQPAKLRPGIGPQALQKLHEPQSGGLVDQLVEAGFHRRRKTPASKAAAPTATMAPGEGGRPAPRGERTEEKAQEAALVGDAPPGLYGASEGLSDRGLPDFSPFERLALEFYAMGFSPEGHLLQFLRPALAQKGVLTAEAVRRMPEGSTVRVAGLVIRPHRPPTRSGRIVVFFTLEDETGLLDVTVFEAVYQRFGHPIFTRPALVVTGRVQRQGEEGVALLARAVEPLSLAPP